MEIEEGEYKNLTYNANRYSDEQWELVKATYKRRWLGIRFASVSDNAVRELPEGRVRRWITERDLWPALLPVMAVSLFCCAVIISVAGVLML